MTINIMAFLLGISLYFNLKSLYRYFYPTKEFYFGEIYIFRNSIIVIDEEKDDIINYYYVELSKTPRQIGYDKFVHRVKKEKLALHRKVLEREAVLYTDELWNSLLEKEKIKQEIEEVLKKENVKV